MRNGYKDMATINYDEKQVVLREQTGHEEFKVEFDKYETEEEKKKVEQEAIEFYNNLMEEESKSSLRVIESKLKSVTYYYEEYNSVHYERGIPITDSEHVKKYNMVYNPVFFQLFIAKLFELGEKNNVFIDVSVRYSDELQKYFIIGKILEREQFESLYGIPLKQYYEVMTRNAYLNNMTEEDKFRSEIEHLKKVYIEYMIEDINKGHDKGFIEIDGYQAYLQIAYKHKDVINKEEILRELGFEIDYDNNALKLVDQSLKLQN